MEKVYLDKFRIAWIFMGILTATVAVATIAYLFIEMPIATLWSFVMVSLVGHSNRKRDEPVKEKQPKNEHQEKEKEASSL